MHYLVQTTDAATVNDFIEFYLFNESYFPSTIQSKCPVDALDSSGKTALHHAGKCLIRLGVNYTGRLLMYCRLSLLSGGHGKISCEIKFKL